MQVKQITSRDNDVFCTLLDCLKAKGIKKHGLFMVFGERAVRDVLDRHGDRARNLVLCHGSENPLLTLARKTARADFSVIELSAALFKELDIFGTGVPILVMRRPELASADLTAVPQGLEILCGLSDPSNVGALLRSAAAFGADRIVFLKESASPFHPRSVRAASAATLKTPYFHGPSIHDLNTICGPVIALDMNGESIDRFSWPVNARLLMGEEGLGIPGGLKSQHKLQIPIDADVESLNATVAASIALYAYRRQFPL